MSEETRKKISESTKGEKSPWYGKFGPLSFGWKGGLSNYPYPFEFNKELRQNIHERDNDICQICKKDVANNSKDYRVHHIDYIKNNIKLLNLILLCNHCHTTTNGSRKIWQQALEEYQQARFFGYDIYDK